MLFLLVLLDAKVGQQLQQRVLGGIFQRSPHGLVLLKRSGRLVHGERGSEVFSLHTFKGIPFSDFASIRDGNLIRPCIIFNKGQRPEESPLVGDLLEEQTGVFKFICPSFEKLVKHCQKVAFLLPGGRELVAG